MSQTTDTTVVLPVTDQNPSPSDAEQTVTMPVVTPLAAAPQAAVPAVAPQPTFDAQRARLAHIHRVSARIVSTPQLPAPDQVTMHTYGNGLDLLVHNDLDGSALVPYVKVFGGTVRTMDQPDSQYAPSGWSRYAELLTVVDGVEVRVWSLTELPAPTQPVADSTVETVPDTSADEAAPVSEPVADSTQPAAAPAQAPAAETAPETAPAVTP